MGLDLCTGVLTTTLRAGRLTGVFAGGHEIWHGVHFLLRDEHWRTPALCLGEPVRETLVEGWRVTVIGCFDFAPKVALRVEVDGHDDGSLVISGEARASADTDVNRLGLCLLHPLSVAGRALEVGHDDGRMTRSSFPTLIPAWPPFTAIRALRHEWAPGVWASAEFDGDVFELEDQRNNADASFKTYSRSNFMPRPYRLRAGEVVRQRVRLRVEGLPSADVPWRMAPPRAVPREAPSKPPSRLGIELTRDDLAAPAASAALAAALRPDHLHLAISARARDVDFKALAHVLEAAQAALRVDLLDLSPTQSAAALEHLAARMADAGVAPVDLAVFPTTHEAVVAARGAFPHARIGGGTPDFFAQLNRQERLPALDFLSFTVCPIVHSADDATVMASHLSIAAMLDTLSACHPGVPVQIGPSRIAARHSPLGELAASKGQRRVALAGVDLRESGAFGATWMAGHIAAGLAAGAQAITVMQLSACPAGSPTAALWAQLGRRLRAAGVTALSIGDRDHLAGLRMRDGQGALDLLINLGPAPIEFDGTGCALQCPSAASPVADTAERAAAGHAVGAGRVFLAPYAILSLREEHGIASRE